MIEHSLRVTSLQVLDDPNIDSRHIIRVSGHKNPESVSNYYARRLSAARKRNISSLLANSVGNDENVNSTKRVAVEGVENQLTYFENHDQIDNFMSQIPETFLSPRNQPPSQLNLVPRAFAPLLSHCSNITFNVNVYNK